MNAHEDIECAGEVLHRNKLSPRTHLRNLARKSESPVFGAKLLSYQMVQVLRIADPAAWLAAQHAEGVKLIHLERDTFWQMLSLLKASKNRVFHSDRHNKTSSGAVTVDIEDFLARLASSEKLLAYERTGLAGLPHLKLSYDDELARPDLVAVTMGKLFDYLDLLQKPVSTKLKKLLANDPHAEIANFDALAEAIRAWFPDPGGGRDNVRQVTFFVLEQFPAPTLTIALVVVAAFLFLVTSVVSAAFVPGMFSTNDDLNPSRSLKLAWGVVLGALGLVMILSDSIDAVKSMIALGALPFVFVVLVLIVCLTRALQAERSASDD